ncbi:MAG TPA: hypothetical protein VJ770_23620 [Stellaceae bacterium]|nr:hypothetical protein [Stellaceae bacterium]
MMAGIVIAAIVSFVRPENIFDEGFANVDGWRLLMGEVPYRDFWMIYGPGQPVMLALVFGFFWKSLIVSRSVHVLIQSALLSVFFFTARRFALPVAAGFATFAAALIASHDIYPSYAVIPALLFSALACAATAIRRVPHCGPKARFFIAGICVGLAGVFRQDVGACIGLSLMFGYMLFGENGQRWIALWLISTRTAAIVLPVYGLLLAMIGPVELYDKLVAAPLLLGKLMHLPTPSLLPYPSPYDFRQWLLAWGILAIALAFRIFGMLSRRLEPSLRRISISIAAFALLLGILSYHRFDGPHYAPAVMFTLLLVSFASAFPRLWGVQIRRAVFLFWSFIALMLLLDYRAVPIAQAKSCLRLFDIQGYGIVTADRRQITRLVRSLDPDDRPIFVGVEGRHFYGNDIDFHGNDVMLYFLTGLRPGVKWHELNPGVVTRSDVQAKMISVMNRNHVDLIVLTNTPGSNQKETDTLADRGSARLDQYISDHFHPIHKDKRYALMKRVR